MSPMLHGNDPLPYSLQLCNYKEYFVMGWEGLGEIGPRVMVSLGGGSGMGYV